MTNIIALCGKKSSGKNTLCNFLHGYQLKCYGIINDFYLDEKGGLVINAKTLDENMQEFNADMMIDVTRTDLEFGEWAAYNVWPFIKHYAFASSLKEIAEKLFNIPRECLYGTDDQKNRVMPHLLWENMPGVITHKMVSSFMTGINTPIKTANDYIEYDKDFTDVFKFIIHKPGPMTAREFMQFFGTEIMRKMYDNIWINRTIKDIETEGPQIAIISDCRFKNEAVALKQIGAKLVYLDRSVSASDSHSSENGFDDFTDFDLVIPNSNMTVLDTCKALLEGIRSWDWLEKPVQKESGVKKIK